MLLTIDELLRTLRSAVNIQQEEAEVIDPAYLAMSDEDLTLFIKLAVSRAYPKATSLTDLPSGAEYPVMLLAKIELYTKLAVAKADKIDIGADSTYLKQDQRFQHYMKLVESAKAQYENWLENEGQGEVSSHDVLLDNRHYTRRNYEKQVCPKVRVVADLVLSDTLEFHWSVTDTSHFARFKAFISRSPIVDTHQDGAFFENKQMEGATCIVSTENIRNTSKVIKGLKPDTEYYVAVVSFERNRVWGYDEIKVHTMKEFKEPEVDLEELPKEV